MDFREEKISSPVPKVAAIHDLSGFGRSSLTIVIPTLSTMGIQVCPLPTAVLSSQTAGVEDFTFFDLTFQMSEMLDHWERMRLSFDAVYSGFLGSGKQVALVERCMRTHLRPKGFFLVDPVLGDDGELYPTQTQDIVAGMRKLVALADIITPNFTEACLLLGEKYSHDVSAALLKNYLVRLAHLGQDIDDKHDKQNLDNKQGEHDIDNKQGEHDIDNKPAHKDPNASQNAPQITFPRVSQNTSQNASRTALKTRSAKTVIITSAPCEDDNFIRVVAYEAAREKFWQVKSPKIDISYPGTGDTFASVFLGSLLQKDSVPMAMARATRFVYEAILVSSGYDVPVNEGVMLEKILPSLGKYRFCEYEVF